MSSAGQHQDTATQSCCQARSCYTPSVPPPARAAGCARASPWASPMSQPHVPLLSCQGTGGADCNFGWRYVSARAPAQHQPRAFLSAPRHSTANFFFLLVILPWIAGKRCHGWSDSCWISPGRTLTTEVQQSDFAYQDFKEIWGIVRWRILLMWKDNYYIYFRICYPHLETVLKKRACIAGWYEKLAWWEVEFWWFQGDEGFILHYLGAVEA